LRRKRRFASIVPENAHNKAQHGAVETNPREGHIAGMSAKPNDQAEPLAQQPSEKPADPPAARPGNPPTRPREIGGPKGPEPTRYGDWEVGGRCTDF
jgi:hypothetical protein